ncbi:MAG: hypothetical protein IPK93_11930 [Solirubrobacterales bacterium]|nr:hypothetical protein [Solirubrobacterales bacterium]
MVDDGRLVNLFMRKVKRCPDPAPAGLFQAVDQSFHLVMLWATALLASALG